MGKNFLNSSLQNASFNIIFQILFRCLTFVLNAFVLRNVNQSVIGVMNVRLLLLESTILFLTREAFRRACLSKTVEHNWKKVINLLWLTVPLCCIFCFLFGWIWLYVLEPPDPQITIHYTIGVNAIAISCIIEMCVEPLYLVAQAFLFVRLKVVLDTVHIIVRTIIFIVLVLWWPGGAVVAFSVAQIAAVVVYVTGYYIYFVYYIAQQKQKCGQTTSQQRLVHQISTEDDFPFTSMWEFLPSYVGNESVVDWKLCVLTWSFFKQGVMKQLLTEGERYVMTVFSVLSFYEQGVFDVVNNLGSLAARFLFRPIEESAYFYFSQLIHRDKRIEEQNSHQMQEAALVLQQLLRGVVSLGLLALCFGQAYSRLALLLYGGSRLSEGLGPLLLRTHCLAILLLAINGTTECYALATMNAAQLDRYNQIMAGLSVGFLIISWLLTSLLGSVGFILANCCNMTARIIHSVLFIKCRYKGTVFKPLVGLFPRFKFFCSIVLSLLITLISEALLYEESKVIHLLVGTICLIAVIATWTYEEKDLIVLGLQRWNWLPHKAD